MDASRFTRGIRQAVARLPRPGLSRVPDMPALPVRDPWPGDSNRGARLLKGEMELGGNAVVLRPGTWADASASPLLRAYAHSFVWLRDLRALGTDPARARARALATDWIGTISRRASPGARMWPAPASPPGSATSIFRRLRR